MKKLLIVILLAFVGASILTIMFTSQTSSNFNFDDDDDDDDDDEGEMISPYFTDLTQNFGSTSILNQSKVKILKYKNLIISNKPLHTKPE